MRIIVSILLLFFITESCQSQELNFSIAKSFWNLKSSTLDVVLTGDTKSIEELYANYEKLRFTVDGISNLELAGISKGIDNLSEENMSNPSKVLIIMDQGENNDSSIHLSTYKQFAAEIIAKHSTDCVFDLKLLSSSVSPIERVTKFSLNSAIQQLSTTIHSGANTKFRRLFKTIDFSEYKKAFVLTNGMSPLLTQHEVVYEDILNSEELGTAQIIPLSSESNINHSFFTYLEELNIMSVNRPANNFVPAGDMSKSSDNRILVLKYQQTLETPIKNKPYTLQLVIDTNEGPVQQKLTTTLRPFTSAVLNTSMKPLVSALKESILIGGALCLFLFYLIPLFNRITFKQKHVFDYRKIKEEGLTHTDPLKMSKISDDDIVVNFGNHVMLLESWKYIKDNMSNPKYAKEYKHFFVDSIQGSLFDQFSGKFKYVIGLWASGIVSLIFTIAYIFVSRDIFLSWHSKEIYSNINGGVNPEIPLVENLFAVCVILLGVTFIIGVIDWSQDKQIKWQQIFGKSLLGVLFSIILIIGVSKLLSFGINSLPIQLLFLVSISVFIVLSSFKFSLSSVVDTAKKLGIVIAGSYLVYNMLNTYGLSSYLSDNLLFQSTNFLFFALVSSLYLIDQKGAVKIIGLKVISPAEIDQDIYHLEEYFQQELEAKFSIGKSPDSDLYVKWLDIDVALNHATITKEDDQYTIEPKEGSIYINQSEVIGKTVINVNDEIRLSTESISHFKIINV